jgi:membrane-associated protein
MEFVARAVEIVLNLDRHLDVLVQQYGPWAYGILFAIIFCETGLVVTPFLPGDSLLFAAGALAGAGAFQVWTLALLLVAAAVLGDAANYWIGRALGGRLLRARRVRVIRQEHLDRTHAFYERHGPKTIVLARFVPIIRTFAPFVAGLGRMTYARFTVYNVSGGLLWIALFVFGGYYFGNIPAVKANIGLVIIGVIVVSLVPVVLEILRARRPRSRKDS